jgi:hypothetical protein
MVTLNKFVVYEDGWPLRAFPTLEGARQWAERNCRPHDYEIKSGGKAVEAAQSLEDTMNSEALW